LKYKNKILFIAGSIVGHACWVEIHLPDACYVVGKNLVNFLETSVETRGKHVECQSGFHAGPWVT
jgi:hypothetical protein